MKEKTATSNLLVEKWTVVEIYGTTIKITWKNLQTVSVVENICLEIYFSLPPEKIGDKVHRLSVVEIICLENRAEHLN